MLMVVLLSVLAVLFYKKYIKPLQYWKEKEVPYATPIPIFGNMFENFIRTKANYEIVADIYKNNEDKRWENIHKKNKTVVNYFNYNIIFRYVGYFQFATPMLILRDPKLVKQICVKDFEIFPQHTGASDDQLLNIWNRNLIAVGSKYKLKCFTIKKSIHTI